VKVNSLYVTISRLDTLLVTDPPTVNW